MRSVLLALVVGGLFVSLLPVSVWAASIPELQQRKEALEQKIKSDQAARDQKRAEQRTIQDQIEDLEGEIRTMEEQIEATDLAISITRAEIEDKNREIQDREQALANERSHQAETLRVIYETGNTSTLEMLIGSESFSEVLVYRDYLDALEDRIQRTIEEVARIKAELEQARTTLQEKDEELTREQSQQEQYRRALAAQQAQKERLLANAKSAERSLESQIAEAQSVYTDVDHELTRLMEEARRRAEQRANGEIPRGISNVGFQVPVNYRYISVNFGGRTPFQRFHTGIDYVNSSGTEVEAAADGVVTHIGKLNYGYGQFVVVTHNEKWASLYAHFQDFAPNLAVGQELNLGDLVGYVGSTGWSTGPHLHFEIRENGVPVDPADYLP